MLFIDHLVNHRKNFETFIDNFELNLETLSRKNPFPLVAIGNLIVKAKVWCCNDNTTSQGKALENVTSQFGLHQVINEPTHILHDSSSCIDLIFALQPSLIIEYGVHTSLHPNCHHQLIYAKLTSKFIIHHNNIERYGTAIMQILNLLDVQSISLMTKNISEQKRKRKNEYF